MTVSTSPDYGVNVFNIKVVRLALNEDQIKELALNSNPAKVKDTRYAEYFEKFGTESWELDALEPSIILTLIKNAIDNIRDDKMWKASLSKQERDREILRDLRAQMK